MSFSDGEGNTLQRDLGETLTIEDVADGSGNSNLSVDASGTDTLQIAMTDQPTFGTVAVNTAGNGTITGLTNTDLSDPTFGISTRAATEEQLAIVNTQATSPLTFIGDNGPVKVDRKLGETLNVTGGATGTLTTGNIGVEANGTDTLEIKLAESVDLGTNGSVQTGNTTVNNDGVAITGGPSMTASGGIDANNQKITNVAAGDVAPGSTDAVNGGQLDQVETGLTTLGMNFSDGEGNTLQRDLGETLTIEDVADASGNSNLSVDASGTDTLQIAMTDQPTFGTVAVNTAGNGTITGLTNQTLTAANFAICTGRAATEEQLDIVNTQATSPLTFIGDNGPVKVDRKLGETLNVTGGATGTLTTGNIGVEANGADTLEIKLASKLSDLEEVAITDGPTLNDSGIDMNGDKITGLAAGDVAPGSTDAVNGGQLDQVETDLTTLGMSFSDGEGNTLQRDLGETLTIEDVADGSGNSNLSVDASGTDTLQIAMTDQPTFGTVAVNTAGNGTITGLTNTTYDPTNVVADRAATEGQVDQVATDLTDTGFKITADNQDLGGDSNDTVKLGETVNYTNDDSNLVATVRDNEIVYDLAANITVDEVKADDGLGGITTLDSSGVTVTDGTQTTTTTAGDTTYADGSGNTTVASADGTDVTDAAGNNSVYGATGTTVTDAAGNTSRLTGDSLTVGSTNPVEVDGTAGEITGLTNTTYDPTNVVADRAATEGQVDQVATDLTDTGFKITADNQDLGGDSNDTVKLGETVNYTNDDSNLVATVRDNEIVYDLAANITVDEVKADDGLGGITTLDSSGVTVGGLSTNDPTTTVGAGTINVAGVGGINDIAIDGNTGTITGLTNTDLEGETFGEAGRAATEEQLQLVSNTANAGWNLTDGSNEANIGPDGKVSFSGDANINVAQTGKQDDGKIEITLASKLSGLEEVAITDGPALSNTGIDMGGQPITNLASGLGETPVQDIEGDALGNAINAGDLKNVASDLGSEVAAAKTEVEAGPSNNITVADRIGEEGQTIYTVDTADELSFTKLEVGSVTMDAGNVDENGNTLITGVGAGDISEGSTDAINGGQLHQLAGDINNTEGGLGIRYVRTNDQGEDPVSDAFAVGEGSTAVGYEARATATNALALGYKAMAEHQGSVALGENAITSAPVGTETVTIGDNTYTFAGTTPLATVSIGSPGAERTITNLAAGRISETSTDAINGSQLYAFANRFDERLTQVEGDLGEVSETVTGTLPGSGPDAVTYAKDDQGNIDKNTVALGGDEGGTKLTNVAPASITPDSSDAVTGGQLHGTNQNVAGNTADIAGNTSQIAGNTSNIAGNSGDIADNRSRIDGNTRDIGTNRDNIAEIGSTVDKGMNFGADQGDTVNRKLGDTVAITGDNNITTRTTGNGVQVMLNRELDVDSVTAGNTTVSNEGVRIQDGPSMTVDGFDANGTTITNVAPGVNAGDAVNVGQMNALGQRFAQEIGDVHNRIDDVARDASAGIASVAAMGNAPYVPGKLTYHVGGGHHNGESAVGVNFRRTADNGRWSLNAGISGSRAGATIGLGISGVID
ncbi:YadA-like family protein [Halomonas sp. CH40]